MAQLMATWTSDSRTTDSWDDDGRLGVENAYLLLEDSSFTLQEDGSSKLLIQEVTQWTNDTRL